MRYINAMICKSIQTCGLYSLGILGGLIPYALKFVRTGVTKKYCGTLALFSKGFDP